MAKLSDAEKVAKVEEILAATDVHRTRSKREALVAITAVIEDEELPSISVEDSQEPEAIEKPPTAGPGSSAAAWRAYADSQGISLEEGATKAAIIEAVEDAEEDSQEPEAIEV